MVLLAFYHSSGSLSVGINLQLHRMSSGDLQKREKKKNDFSAVHEAEQIKGSLSVRKILHLSISLPHKGRGRRRLISTCLVINTVRGHLKLWCDDKANGILVVN